VVRELLLGPKRFKDLLAVLPAMGTYQFEVGDECFHVQATQGVVTAHSGPAPVAADLLVECDLQTFIALATGELSPPRAVRRGLARIRGEPALFARAFNVLNFSGFARKFELVPAT